MPQLPELPLTHLATPLFIVAILVELTIGKIYGSARFEARDTSINLLTSLVAGVVRPITGVFIGLTLMYVYQHRLFTFEFSWAFVAICFVVDDLMYYIKHRLEQRPLPL